MSSGDISSKTDVEDVDSDNMVAEGAEAESSEKIGDIEATDEKETTAEISEDGKGPEGIKEPEEPSKNV